MNCFSGCRMLYLFGLCLFITACNRTPDVQGAWLCNVGDPNGGQTRAHVVFNGDGKNGLFMDQSGQIQKEDGYDWLQLYGTYVQERDKLTLHIDHIPQLAINGGSSDANQTISGVITEVAKERLQMELTTEGNRTHYFNCEPPPPQPTVKVSDLEGVPQYGNWVCQGPEAGTWRFSTFGYYTWLDKNGQAVWKDSPMTLKGSVLDLAREKSGPRHEFKEPVTRIIKRLSPNQIAFVDAARQDWNQATRCIIEDKYHEGEEYV